MEVHEMSKHSADSLERLKKLEKKARPALQHPQLIGLARDNTPNQTFKLAKELGYPVRQAKAARMLAVLRRDQETEAFDAFLATTEQSSSQGHARENRRPTVKNDRTIRALERITDPGARLRFMERKGLKDMVCDQVRAITAEPDRWQPMFGVDDTSEYALFNTIDVDAAKGRKFMHRDGERSLVSSYSRIILSFLPMKGEPPQSPISIDVDGMCQFAGISEDVLFLLLKPVFEWISQQRPTYSGGQRHFRGTELTVRRVFKHEPQHPLARGVEIWLLRSRLHKGNIFTLRCEALPIPAEENTGDERYELDPIIDRFIELGWDMEQVRNELVAVLDKSFSILQIVHNPKDVIALAGAKCFTPSDSVGKLGRLLREKCRPHIWKKLVESDRGGAFWPDIYLRLCACGMHRLGTDEDRAFYLPEFTKLLGEGRLNRVWQLLIVLGPTVLFYAQLEEEIFGRASEYLWGLRRGAFAHAIEKGYYGVAVALVQQFGQEACSCSNEVLEETRSMAEEFEQPIRLTDEFVYYRAPSWPRG